MATANNSEGKEMATIPPNSSKRPYDEFHDDCDDDDDQRVLEEAENLTTADSRLCGVGSFRPGILQPCASVPFFVPWYCLTAYATSTLFSYVNSQVTTLERQFGFSSSQTGLIMASNDIGFLSCILLFTYFSSKVHIPRSLFILSVLFGLSGLLCSLPHFLFSDTDDVIVAIDDVIATNVTSSAKTDVSAFGQLCLPEGNSTRSTCETPDPETGSVGQHRNSQAAQAIIMIGMMIQGVCKSPRYSYVTEYVDTNIKDRTKTGFYLGIVIALAIFGPVSAYLLSGYFAHIYVTLQPTNLTPRHPKWIGAWWLGFLVFGLFSVISSFPLAFFPRRIRTHDPRDPTLSASSPLKPTDRRAQMLQQMKGFPMALFRLVTNPIYMCVVLSSVCIIFSVGGQQAFMPKYVENQFSLPTWKANLTLAVTTISSASLGSLVGGVLTRHFKLTPLGCLRLGVALQFVSVVATATGFFITCPTPTIHNRPGGEYVNATCFDSCECDDADYLPVCTSDHVTYYSPCHAGCQVAVDQNTYTNCSCSVDGQATAGTCDYSCNMLYVFVSLQALASLSSCSIIVPKFIIYIRSVAASDKAFALGFASFNTSLLGWLLGPVVFGSMIDTVCDIWDSTCSGRGACLLYNNDLFRFRLHTFTAGGPLGSFLFLFLALVIARCTGQLDGLTADQNAGDKQKKKPPQSPNGSSPGAKSA